jgi:hypothetical protein
MKHQYIVPPKRRKEIRALARALRHTLFAANTVYIDVLHILEDVLWENYEIVEDKALKGLEAETYPDERIIRITLSCYEKACAGDGRARLTIAHEIGHFLMHANLGLRLARPAPTEKVPAYMCSEWQADCFAGELLTAPEYLGNMPSIQDAANKFGITPSAARTQARAFIKDGLMQGIGGLEDF